MFNCAICKESIGPKVSPIMVATAVRDRSYSYRFYDIEEETEKSGTSIGTEIIEELKLCKKCAGLDETPKVEAISHETLVGFVRAKLAHGNGCNKALFECKACARMLESVKGTNPFVMADALSDKVAPIMTTRLVDLAFASLCDRTYHNSKRAKSDVKATYAHMAPFSKRDELERKGKRA